MALTYLWADGFDDYDYLGRKYLATTERSGDQATSDVYRTYYYGRGLRAQYFWFGKMLPGAPYTTVFVSFDSLISNGVNFINWLSDNCFVEFMDSTVTQPQVRVRMRYNPLTGGLGLVAMRGSTDIYSWPDLCAMHLWNNLSFRFTVSPAAGEIRVWVNGVDKGGFTGNTQNTANTRVDQIRIACGANSEGWYIDNLVEATGLPTDGPIPPCRIYGENVPNANVAVSWTPSGAASQYQAVDEIPPNDDSDYNSTTVVGDKDVFSHAPISFSGGLAWIRAVKVNVYARRDDATAQAVQPLVRVSSVDYYGSPSSVGNSYFCYSHIFQNNPSNGIPWSATAANSCGFGYRRQ